MTPSQAKIEAGSIPEPNSGCWLWLGCDNGTGYGLTCRGGKQMYAHRVAYEAFHGPITPGLFVCHRCDVRACVNPDHLYEGTHQDNMADRRRKGRQARGAQLGRTKLTAEQVLAIIADGRTQDAIAADYGIRQSNVSRIKHRRIWTHLQEAAGRGDLARSAETIAALKAALVSEGK